jgi:hypothetical protein
MTELNLRCHYQMVRHKSMYGEEYTVHEAFSFQSGGLYMVSPIPVYIAGETVEEVLELASMLEKAEIEKYGIVDIDDISDKIDKYIDYTTVHITVEPDYSTENLDDSDLPEEDYYTEEDKVLDLVEYMKRNT